MDQFLLLVIEDEVHIARFIQNILTNHGYRVVLSFSGREGVSMITSQCPDLVILDLGLPDLDGIDIIKQVRTWSSLPILVVSARTQETEKVNALESGADDYVTKPFGSSELIARIRTCLRHSNKLVSSSSTQTQFYHSGDLTIDLDKRIVSLHGTHIHLTPVEYKIVSYLAQNAGKVITYSTLMIYVWGPYVDMDNKILRVNMANIRRKLEVNPAEPMYIFTEVGVGYRMREEGIEMSH